MPFNKKGSNEPFFYISGGKMNGWAYRKTIPQRQMYIIYIGVNLNNAVIELFSVFKTFYDERNNFSSMKCGKN